MRNLEEFSCVPAQLYMGTSESVQRSTRPRTRLAQVSVRLGMAAPMSQQLFKMHCFIAARVASSKFTWLVSTGLPRSCVHCAPTRLRHHALIHPIPSSCRLHPTQRLPSARHTDVHSQQPLEMNGSVYLLCIRAAVGGVRFVVHCDQCEAPLLDRSVTPECFEFQMLHMARSTSRHHTTCSV